MFPSSPYNLINSFSLTIFLIKNSLLEDFLNTSISDSLLPKYKRIK